MTTHTIHHLKAERATLHGHFSRDLPPALTIRPGDTVRFECLDAGWGLEPHNGVDKHRRSFPNLLPILDDGHALTGPVYVEGAQPGMTLAVRIDGLKVGPWGTTYAGGWKSEINNRFGFNDTPRFHLWTFNHQSGAAVNQFGHTVTMRPFLGVLGMPPAEPGVHSTTPPRPTGGNLDCKELVVGSTLYLPIAVEGGLFSAGDGHAAQGDGEICETAIECPMERADLAFDLLDNMPLTFPVANTPAGWLAMGFHQDLDEATFLAMENMLALLQRLHGLERLDAFALASLAVDFHVTQIVNSVKGVHAILPHGAIKV